LFRPSFKISQKPGHWFHRVALYEKNKRFEAGHHRKRFDDDGQLQSLASVYCVLPDAQNSELRSISDFKKPTHSRTVQYSTFSRLTSRPTQIGIKAMMLACVLENRLRSWNRSAEGNALFEVLYFVFLSSDKKLNRIRSRLL
jgi:hypothetical protein